MNILSKKLKNINTVLSLFPAWRSTTESWTGVSLRNQVWLLNFFFMRTKFHIQRQAISCSDLYKVGRFFKDRDMLGEYAEDGPTVRAPELLEKKSEIEKFLGLKDLTKVDYSLP